MRTHGAAALPRDDRRARLSRFGWVWLASLLSACDGAHPTPVGAGPNVLLITIDTLRADHLSCYGYVRETSPNLDALARHGLLFERALSTSGSTLPAHLSILTGLLPHQHGFLSNKRALMGPFRSTPGRESVTQAFQEAGWVTWGIVSGNTVKRPTGLDSGFHVWDQPSSLHRKAADTLAVARGLLERYAAENVRRPFFLWLHFWDVHEPNDPPEPWRSMFRAGPEIEALLAQRRVDERRLQERFTPTEIARLFYPDLVIPLLEGQAIDVPPIDHAKLLELYDAYDGSIRYVDEQIGILLADLEARGLRERTLVAVVGDHGQALGQHDWLEHGRIQRDIAHVPMIIDLPGEAPEEPRREPCLASVVDLMPTLVARIGHPAFDRFRAQATGRDLLDPGYVREWAFSHRSDRERDWEPGTRVAVERGRWRFYESSEVPDELYDLESDPGEWTDLAPDQPELVEELRVLVGAILRHLPSDGGPQAPADPEESARFAEGLKELGYLGSEEE